MYRDEQLGERRPNVAATTADLSDYGRRPRSGATGQPKRHNIQLPFGKAMTVKHAYRIAGQLPDVVVDERDESREESHRSDVMEKIAWSVIRASRGDTGLASAAWDASEVGAACFDMYFEDSAQIPIFRRIDPAGIIEVQGLDDPHDFQRVYRTWDASLASVAAQYRGKTFRGQPVLVDDLRPHSEKAGSDMLRIVSCCSKDTVTRFAFGAEDGQVVGLFEHVHGYGFVPYVVIPNIGPYEDVWGWADYEFVRSMVHYLPLLYSREADVLKAVANGGMIERGTGATPQDIARVTREGGVVPSKRDGSIEPIQAPDMPSFHDSHSARGMEFLKMLGFTPDAAWGTGAAGSGTDRGLQLQPMLEYTSMKQLNWAAGLSRLFGMSFRMIESQMKGKTKYRGSKPTSGGRKLPFVMEIGPEADPIVADETDEFGMPTMVPLPRTPKELFDNDYEIRFIWRNRIDPDDPQYVSSELNKFTTGVQSLETTLGNLGIAAPEDEMKRIEAEAKRFPWINQGLVSMLLAQLKNGEQGDGGGAPFDQSSAMQGAMDTMTGGEAGAEGGALNADATAGALPPGGAAGPMYGGA